MAGNQANRLYPYYLVYINQSGDVVYDYTQAKYLLDVARKACRGIDQPIPKAYESFNRKTDDGRNMGQYSALLDIVIHSIRLLKRHRRKPWLWHPIPDRPPATVSIPLERVPIQI
jgi:hypothetical protein